MLSYFVSFFFLAFLEVYNKLVVVYLLMMVLLLAPILAFLLGLKYEFDPFKCNLNMVVILSFCVLLNMVVLGSLFFVLA